LETSINTFQGICDEIYFGVVFLASLPSGPVTQNISTRSYISGRRSQSDGYKFRGPQARTDDKKLLIFPCVAHLYHSKCSFYVMIFSIIRSY